MFLFLTIKHNLTMATSKEQEILDKIKIVLTQKFENPEAAFSFFDKDGDGTLNKKEIEKLLKQAEVSGFIRGLVASKLIEKFDNSADENIGWEEFETAVSGMV